MRNHYYMVLTLVQLQQMSMLMVEQVVLIRQETFTKLFVLVVEVIVFQQHLGFIQPQMAHLIAI